MSRLKSAMDSVSTTTIVYRISPTDQNAQERHTCQKDVPPEALIPQIHQTILSPSASHIRNILSDATYPLGLRSKRRFQGRATSLHKIRSDILSILDDSEVQRLENIFWNSKKGWARTSFLEDELRAFLKAKALEKKGRQRVSIVSPDVFPIPEITGKKKKLQTKEATNAGSLFKRESKTRSLRHMSMKDQGKPKEILLRRKITEGELEALSLLEEGSSSIFGTDSMSTMLSESVCSKYAPILSTRQGGKKTDIDAKKKKDAQDDKRAAKAKGSKMQFRRTSDPDDKYDKKWKARGEVSDSRRESKDLLRRDSKSQFKRGIWFDEDGAISRAVREQLQKIKPLDYSDDRQPVFVEDEDTKDSKVEKESETDKRKKRKKPHGTLAPDVLSEWEKSGLSTPSRQSLSAFGQPLARRRGGSANGRASSLSDRRESTMLTGSPVPPVPKTAPERWRWALRKVTRRLFIGSDARQSYPSAFPPGSTFKTQTQPSFADKERSKRSAMKLDKGWFDMRWDDIGNEKAILSETESASAQASDQTLLSLSNVASADLADSKRRATADNIKMLQKFTQSFISDKQKARTKYDKKDLRPLNVLTREASSSTRLKRRPTKLDERKQSKSAKERKLTSNVLESLKPYEEIMSKDSIEIYREKRKEETSEPKSRKAPEEDRDQAKAERKARKKLEKEKKESDEERKKPNKTLSFEVSRSISDSSGSSSDGDSLEFMLRMDSLSYEKDVARLREKEEMDDNIVLSMSDEEQEVLHRDKGEEKKKAGKKRTFSQHKLAAPFGESGLVEATPTSTPKKSKELREDVREVGKEDRFEDAGRRRDRRGTEVDEKGEAKRQWTSPRRVSHDFKPDAVTAKQTSDSEIDYIPYTASEIDTKDRRELKHQTSLVDIRRAESEMDAREPGEKKKKDPSKKLVRHLMTMSPTKESEIALSTLDDDSSAKKIKKSQDDEDLNTRQTILIKEVIQKLEQHMLKTYGIIHYSTNKIDSALTRSDLEMEIEVDFDYEKHDPAHPADVRKQSSVTRKMSSLSRESLHKHDKHVKILRKTSSRALSVSKQFSKKAAEEEESSSQPSDDMTAKHEHDVKETTQAPGSPDKDLDIELDEKATKQIPEKRSTVKKSTDRVKERGRESAPLPKGAKKKEVKPQKKQTSDKISDGQKEMLENVDKKRSKIEFPDSSDRRDSRTSSTESKESIDREMYGKDSIDSLKRRRDRKLTRDSEEGLGSHDAMHQQRHFKREDRDIYLEESQKYFDSDNEFSFPMEPAKDALYDSIRRGTLTRQTPSNERDSQRLSLSADDDSRMQLAEGRMRALRKRSAKGLDLERSGQSLIYLPKDADPIMERESGGFPKVSTAGSPAHSPIKTAESPKTQDAKDERRRSRHEEKRHRRESLKGDESERVFFPKDGMDEWRHRRIRDTERDTERETERRSLVDSQRPTDTDDEKVARGGQVTGKKAAQRERQQDASQLKEEIHSDTSNDELAKEDKKRRARKGKATRDVGDSDTSPQLSGYSSEGSVSTQRQTGQTRAERQESLTRQKRSRRELADHDEEDVHPPRGGPRRAEEARDEKGGPKAARSDRDHRGDAAKEPAMSPSGTIHARAGSSLNLLKARSGESSKKRLKGDGVVEPVPKSLPSKYTSEDEETSSSNGTSSLSLESSPSLSIISSVSESDIFLPETPSQMDRKHPLPPIYSEKQKAGATKKPKKIQPIPDETAQFGFTQPRELSTSTTVTTPPIVRGGLPKLPGIQPSAKRKGLELYFRSRMSLQRRMKKCLPSLIDRPIPLQTRRVIKNFDGWDIGMKVQQHTLNHLPAVVETIPQLIKACTPKKVPGFKIDQLINSRTHINTSEAGLRYVFRYGIEELFEFMVFTLVLEKPDRPLDHLIELTRSIKREMMIRYNVGKLMAVGSEPSLDSISTTSSQGMHSSSTTTSSD
ncbi:hypothetical protein BgiMline_034546 [Biomphalaria glabrata]|nr:hypothetical protein BgiMline_020691 [Biomphalaria glabrata]